ncbi:unnamed protein product [marine sediment metagenome]|uniref:Uncharacterized protein n=1 Tax=marine sediment metagenome TaxID=412755 RepID=X1L763_9ZZZZ
MSVQSEVPKKRVSRRKKLAIIAIVLLLVLSMFFGLLYYQMSNLQVSINIEETQVVSWIWEIINGRIPNLVVRLTFTNPTFLQVDVTDIYAQLHRERVRFRGDHRAVVYTSRKNGLQGFVLLDK